MYTLNDIPQKSDVIIGKLGNYDGEGVIGVKSGYEVIRVFSGALELIQKFYLGQFPESMRLAIASSADTPQAVSIGKSALNLLEVVPGVTVRQVFSKGWEERFEGNVQIGRTPPLTSSKAKSHFPILQRETGVSYSKMLFFDDCNWDDHCANVERECVGVVTHRTPRGFQWSDWETGLSKYALKYPSDP